MAQSLKEMQNAKCKMQSAKLEKRIMDNIIENKSFEFAVRIVKLYQHLTENKKEFVMSK